MTSWYDMDSDDRAAVMDRAEEENGGESWYDLDSETRVAYIEAAEENR